MKKSWGQHGFTLIEVAVAAVIILLTVLPLTDLFSSGWRNFRRSLKDTTAINLAQQKMEEILVQGPGSIDGDPIYWQQFSDCPEFRYQVDISEKDIGLYKIIVRVQYDLGEKEKEISLASYCLDK